MIMARRRRKACFCAIARNSRGTIEDMVCSPSKRTVKNLAKRIVKTETKYGKRVKYRITRTWSANC